MTFVIEDNIPVPDGRGASTKYPFGKLAVGQSFFASIDDLPKTRTAFYNAAHGYGKYHNKKLVVRKVDGGFRCWRLA